MTAAFVFRIDFFRDFLKIRIITTNMPIFLNTTTELFRCFTDFILRTHMSCFSHHFCEAFCPIISYLKLL